jgi:hypothetical protein
MTRNSAKQSAPTTKDGRQVAYAREMCITICERYVRGEDLKAICAKLPMPTAPIFLKWVQENPEGRAIHRCATNFISDRTLANTLDVPFDYTAGDWANAIRAKLERGHPVDYIDRPFVPPDWDKVYPLIGYPPVWPTEDMATYNKLRDEYTEMLKPDDLMQLGYTKEVVDAIWECAREARAKNAEPRRQYVQRRINEAIAKRQERIKIEPATADDLSNGFRAGFKHHQALDMAQARKMKRRDSALRQIERWRAGLGGKAKALSDKFISDQALAERYGGTHLAGTDTDDRVPEATEPAPPVAPDQVVAPSNCAGDAVQKAPPVDLSGEPQKAVTSVAPAGATSVPAGDPANAAQSVPAGDPANGAEAATLVAGSVGEAAPTPTNDAPQVPPPPAPAEQVTQAAPTASGANGQAAPPPAPAEQVAQTALTASGANGHAAPPPPAEQVAQTAPTASGANGHAAPPPAPAKQVAQTAPTASGANGHAAPPPPAEQVAQTAPTASGANGHAAPPLASAREIAQATTERGLRNEAADTATSRTSNEVEVVVGGVTERINWVAWLTGAKRYNWCFLSKAGEQAFERLFPSKRELVRHAVFDRKIIRPDEVCPALAPWLQGPELPSLRLFGVARGEARP